MYDMHTNVTSSLIFVLVRFRFLFCVQSKLDSYV